MSPLKHLGLLLLAAALSAAEPAKVDERYPFRTDFANAHLPWYRLKDREFPPYHSDHRVGVRLESVDFIHRTGVFRENATGRALPFQLTPYCGVYYLNAPADLRDIPLGTNLLAFLYPDPDGGPARVVQLIEDYTTLASHGFTYRLDAVKPDALTVTKQNLAKKELDLGRRDLPVNATTRFWKDGKSIQAADLAPGDLLLCNIAGRDAKNPGWCTEVYVGAETHRAATEAQRAKQEAFVRHRGYPAWIDRVEAGTLTITLFCDPDSQGAFAKTITGLFPVKSGVRLVVANDELRTWNPGVDNERCELLEITRTPVHAYGDSGIHFKIRISNLLEGFREGRIVRIFPGGDKLKDQFYGESLMGYGYSGLRSLPFRENKPKEYPEDFAYRTDYGNAHLPWYQVREGVPPPRFSEHLRVGALTKVAPDGQGGEFREERTGETVVFTLLATGGRVNQNFNKLGAPQAEPGRFQAQVARVRYAGADAELADIPLGTLCRFHTYQDASGAFTRVAVVSDHFSYLDQSVLTYRVAALKPKIGRFEATWHVPEVLNYQNEKEDPPPFGRTEFRTGPETRFWKDGKPAGFADLTPGETLLLNLTGDTPEHPAVCTDVWIGAASIRAATEAQARKRAPAAKK